MESDKLQETDGLKIDDFVLLKVIGKIHSSLTKV